MDLMVPPICQIFIDEQVGEMGISGWLNFISNHEHHNMPFCSKGVIQQKRCLKTFSDVVIVISFIALIQQLRVSYTLINLQPL